MRIRERGVTLIEIVAAALLGALIAGGALMAFVTATRISRGSSDTVGASSFAQQTLERFRNRIACGEGNPGEWFNPACAPTLPPAGSPDALPAGALYEGNAPRSRNYTVSQEDCDGVGGVGDCFKVMVKVEWNPPQ